MNKKKRLQDIFADTPRFMREDEQRLFSILQRDVPANTIQRLSAMAFKDLSIYYVCSDMDAELYVKIAMPGLRIDILRIGFANKKVGFGTAMIAEIEKIAAEKNIPTVGIKGICTFEMACLAKKLGYAPDPRACFEVSNDDGTKFVAGDWLKLIDRG